MNISLKKNIPDNIKSSLGEILFSQISSFIEDIKGLKIDKKVIFKIIETILDKYPFVDDKNKTLIFKLICISEKIEKIKREIENNEDINNFTLNIDIIKEYNKGKK